MAYGLGSHRTHLLEHLLERESASETHLERAASADLPPKVGFAIIGSLNEMFTW